jgi:hypothetical protein
MKGYRNTKNKYLPHYLKRSSESELFRNKNINNSYAAVTPVILVEPV